MRVFVVELGTGVDPHGGDATSAALKAVRDCFNHVSLAGLDEVAGLHDANLMAIEVLLGVPEGLGPVDAERVAAAFPYGHAEIQVQQGGLRVPGSGGRLDDFITVVNAALIVRVP
jgi:uncharacterized protein (TIGR02058 family)